MKKFRYSFAPDENSRDGIFAVITGGLSLLLMAAAAILSFALGGQAKTAVGAIGLFAFLLSLYGFIVGILSLREKGVNHRFSLIGSISSGIMAVIWLAVFFGGIK